MDQNNNNYKPVGNQRPISVDGFAPPRPGVSNNQAEANTNSPLSKVELGQQLLNSQPVTKTKTARVAKVWLGVFIFLFLVAAAAAGFFYLRYTTSRSDLQSEKDKYVNLQEQLNAARNDAAADAKTAAEDLTEYKNYATELSTLANQLKTTCGKNCANVVIPTAPADSTQ